MRWTRTRAAGALAIGTAAALVLSACGSSGPEQVDVTREPVTITVGYWGNFGIGEDTRGPSLESQYEGSHPWVNIVLTSGDYTKQHDVLKQALIAGSGAFTVSAVEEAYITGFVAESDRFVNLLDFGAGDYKDRYLPWKWAQASSADGNTVIGLGFDVGGLGLCYRADLFEAAGLNSDREAVSAALGGSWEDFIAVGEEYFAATGKKFVDNATNILAPALAQLGTGYTFYDTSDALRMENVKPAFDVVTALIEADLSANIGLYTDEWYAGLSNGDFAVLPCPSWMLPGIKEWVSGETFTGKWDVADIPGDGGNWGGSFYTIPNQGSENQKQEAYNFIEWLVQEPQQAKIMEETGKLPSQTALLQSDTINGFTNEFFQGAPYGQIFAKSVLDIPAAVYLGPKNGLVRTAVEMVLNQVQAGQVAMTDAWDSAVAAAEAADA